MRSAALITLVLTLAACSSAASAGPRASESLTVVSGRGVVEVKGKGALLGRIDRGWLQIVDLTPRDEWSPWVKGVPRGKVVGTRGENITFRILKGRYKVIARGEGISISARGEGSVLLDGEPDKVGDTGQYAIGDAARQPLPDDPVRLGFGAQRTMSSGRSVKIRP